MTRNKFEARVAATLPARYQYEALRLPYTIDHHYLPDWIDIDRKEIIEAKGLFDATDRRKMKAIRRQYPDWSITIIFQNPSLKISKKSATTYARWCESNGILWKPAP